MVAGEQRLLFLEQITKMVRRMPRRVDDAQRRRSRQGDALAALEEAVGSKACVLPLWVQGQQAMHYRIRARLQRQGRRRMVVVGMGRKYPADRPRRGG